MASRQGTYRGIARRYSVSEDAISRHVANRHISELLKLAADAERAARGDSLLDRIESLHARTLAILEATEETKDHRIALAAIREARHNLELVGEVTKELDRTPTLNLYLNPEWLRIEALIVRTLDSYPDAQAAIVHALEGEAQANGRD